MRRTGVSAEQLNRECKTKDFDELSDITVEYRKYGFKLNLSEVDVKEIERDPNLLHSAKDKTAAVLRKWHRKNPTKATYDALLEVALKLEDRIVAERICLLCAASEAKGNPVAIVQNTP